MKKLTKANCNKYGIEVAPQYDFTDDGNRFRGFIYKGMPMTQCFSDDICYLCIRVDYRNTNFTYKEWMQTEEYKLCDEFNGVTEIDPDKLVNNLEKVIAKVNEMNDSAEISEEELDNLKNRIENEVEEIENFVEDVKRNFAWWEIESDAKMNMIRQYMKVLAADIRVGKKMIDDLFEMSILKQKSLAERSSIFNHKFYMEQIRGLIA